MSIILPLNKIIYSHCLEGMKSLPDNCADCCVTDPPYLLEFMGKDWDKANVVDPEFGYWFAGFTDGEGCFRIHKTHGKTSTTYTCTFQIKLRDDDDLILQTICRQLKIGHICSVKGEGNSKDQSAFVVHSKAECLKLREVFNSFPLRAKKQRDFIQWSKHLDLWVKHEYGADKTELERSYEDMKLARSYENTKPPMNKQAFFHYLWAKEVLRVLKPGAHMFFACGTRTQHRMTQGVEDAGFEIRDVISWHYGSGFPKSLDISKAIDKAAGAERQITKPGQLKPAEFSGKFDNSTSSVRQRQDEPTTEGAKQWDGWGTALKPATEFWTLARKPLSENTIAANVIKHGTGSLNIDSCRIPFRDPKDKESATWGTGVNIIGGNYAGGNGKSDGSRKNIEANESGRFPANVILDEFMAAEMDKQSGQLTSGKPSGKRNVANKNVFGSCSTGGDITGYGDTGGASRFFYVAKPSPEERGNTTHPTVKPQTLIQYLIKLICPIEPGRIVLEPFAGSGSHCIASRKLGLDFIAYEIEEHSCNEANERLTKEMGLFI